MTRSNVLPENTLTASRKKINWGLLRQPEAILKTVIFDLDGTLVDTLGDLTDSMNYALASLDQPIHQESVTKKFIGDGIFTFASRALKEDQRHLTGEVVKRMREHYRGNCLKKTSVYPGVKGLVAELKKRGGKVAVLTNKDQNVARMIVEHYFGKDVFNRIVGVVDRVPVKPGSRAAMKLMAEMDVAKEDCLMVGDSGIDIDTAKAAGIRSIGVSWGFRGCQELMQHGADVIINVPNEILDVI
jgi:phosphoglycolate phosphatase